EVNRGAGRGHARLGAARRGVGRAPGGGRRRGRRARGARRRGGTAGGAAATAAAAGCGDGQDGPEHDRSSLVQYAHFDPTPSGGEPLLFYGHYYLYRVRRPAHGEVKCLGRAG